MDILAKINEEPQILLQGFVWLYLWTYWSIFCHEMGHFICAKIVKFNPYLVRVGGGIKILKINLNIAIFELGLFPIGGLTVCDRKLWDLCNLRTRYVWLAAAGPLANLLLLIILIFNYDKSGEPFLVLLMVFEARILLLNLIPDRNDGESLTSAIAFNYPRYVDSIFEEYKQMLLKYETDESKFPDKFLNGDIDKLQKFIKAQYELQNRNFSTASKLFVSILRTPKISDLEKASILNCLTYIVAMAGSKKYLKPAAIWSKKALKLAPHCKLIIIHRGAILVEIGEYEAGKQMLLPFTVPGSLPIEVGVCSCYLAKAEYFMGNKDTAINWLLKAKETGVVKEILERIEEDIDLLV
ncbi:MAG: hypothetical protein F6K35_24660 [Okeania sp. SIO2H7]|nr:hypothetical protein [Okeania sp. SIO2H7]